MRVACQSTSKKLMEPLDQTGIGWVILVFYFSLKRVGRNIDDQMELPTTKQDFASHANPSCATDLAYESKS